MFSVASGRNISVSHSRNLGKYLWADSVMKRVRIEGMREGKKAIRQWRSRVIDVMVVRQTCWQWDEERERLREIYIQGISGYVTIGFCDYRILWLSDSVTTRFCEYPILWLSDSVVPRICDYTLYGDSGTPSNFWYQCPTISPLILISMSHSCPTYLT